MNGQLVYAYGVVRAARCPAVGRDWPQLPNAAPTRVLPLGGRLWLFVADVPAADFGDAALGDRVKDVEWIARCGAAHHEIAVRAGMRAAFVPFRLFTLFLTDTRAIASTARIRGSIERALTRVEGCREWVVRAAIDPNAAAGLTATRPTSGTEYLARRAEDRRRVRRPPRGASKLAGELAAAVAAKARRSARRRGADPGMLLDLALLVPRARERDVTAAVRRWSPKLAALGCRVWQTGPWPPYSFVSIGTLGRVGSA